MAVCLSKDELLYHFVYSKGSIYIRIPVLYKDTVVAIIVKSTKKNIQTIARPQHSDKRQFEKLDSVLVTGTGGWATRALAWGKTV